MLKKIYKEYRSIFILGLLSLFIGVVVGTIDTVFGKILISITEFRQENPFKLIPFLSLIGVFIIYVYNKYGNDTIKGMTLIFQTANGETETIHNRLIPFTMVSTWLTHLFGGSAGREGVAVQIGATVAHNAGRLVHVPNSKRILIVSGMAAGFAGLFQTPIAAVFFALEVLVAGTLEYNALFTSLIAAFSASTTSHLLGLEKFSFNLEYNLNMSLDLIIKLAICGVIFGIVGGLFAHLLGYMKKYLSAHIKNPILRIFSIGIILSILLLLLYKGRYSGLGTNLISASFNGDEIYYFDWIFKFLLTILTLSAGYQGGEVTPLFSIGASLGIALGSILGLPIQLTAALGYAAVFGGATNTFLAPIFIGAEVFGFNSIPLFFVTCALSYVFNGSKSIYSAQQIFDNMKI